MPYMLVSTKYQMSIYLTNYKTYIDKLKLKSCIKFNDNKKPTMLAKEPQESTLWVGPKSFFFGLCAGKLGLERPWSPRGYQAGLRAIGLYLTVSQRMIGLMIVPFV